MPDSYPYIISNNKIDPILAQIRKAARPTRFSQKLLVKWGFSASNDRAIIPLMRELGFINENGTPSANYDHLRDPKNWKRVLGGHVRELYSDLFAIDSNIDKASDEDVKGAMARVTGKDEESVKRYYATFKTLIGLADLKGEIVEPEENGRNAAQETVEKETLAITPVVPVKPARSTEYHYNLQIHLPPNGDLATYNAIFRALRENLGL